MQSIAQPCSVRVAASARVNSTRKNAVTRKMDIASTPKACAFSMHSARESRSVQGSNSFKRDILKRERLSRRSLKTKATGARCVFRIVEKILLVNILLPSPPYYPRFNDPVLAGWEIFFPFECFENDDDDDSRARLNLLVAPVLFSLSRASVFFVFVTDAM